ncbi:unnamed protein product [Cuscuta epithymum]|uniref:Leucine-rich repeat-containing N-terminal plant-type domain-containing protein n=1 Tax=Cuscuta epithymum TaxID=186058 RepID=A0AAV0E4N8_9ASTE|nr:unnamed protein product [Cuscuta epithymum]
MGMKKCGASRPIVIRWLAAFAVTAAVAAALRSPESDVIDDLKASLHVNDTYWNPTSERCEWPGILCDSTNSSVVHVDIPMYGFAGTLPENLGKLTGLITFDATGNNITGAIPAFNGSLKLSTLSLDRNRFTSIPDALFHSKPQLSFVSLDYNLLLPPWELPEALANCSQLGYFSAINCNIRVPFPAFFKQNSQLSVLRLTGNNLSGQLPSDLPVSLTTLSLGHQGGALSGSISGIQKLTNLIHLCLDGNTFSGEIPDLSPLKNLKEFVVSHNILTGPVPESISAIASSLAQVNLSSNNLTGVIPPKLKDFAFSGKLDVSNNKLSGIIPSNLPNFPQPCDNVYY